MTTTLTPQLTEGKTTPLRILLIEENIVSQTMIRGLLDKLGHQVDAYTNGQSAADYYNQNHSSIDVILLDMELDEPNAEKTLQLLKKLPAPAPPIVAMYMDQTAQTLKQIRSMGISCFLRKPLKLNNLKKMAEKLQTNTVSPTPYPSPPPPDSAEPLNPVRLAEITSGDEEMKQELVSIFLSQTPEILHRLETAIKNNDWQAVKKEAHTLKGSAANLGADKLSALMKELEMDLSQDPDPAAFTNKLSSSKQELSRIKNYYEAE